VTHRAHPLEDGEIWMVGDPITAREFVLMVFIVVGLVGFYTQARALLLFWLAGGFA
jgi:hypothetical protein